MPSGGRIHAINKVGARAKLLLREVVQVTAAGGPAPAQGWRPSDVIPDLSRQ